MGLRSHLAQRSAFAWAAVLAVAALAAFLALGTGRARGDAATACTGAQSGRSVTIQSCSFTLQSSPGGNPDYFVNVTIKYTSPSPQTPVRFRCALGNGSTQASQYGVLRSSGATLTFVSPFVSQTSGLKTVACFVDAT